jgi:hypothetical protein
MNKPKRYSFHFETDFHPDLVRWRYTDEADHAANVHKTFKPKLSDLVIETKLDGKLKTQIRRELLEDILKEDEV